LPKNTRIFVDNSPLIDGAGPLACARQGCIIRRGGQLNPRGESGRCVGRSDGNCAFQTPLRRAGRGPLQSFTSAFDIV